jgi:hydroxymethylpyrimidine kinase/phosphomethylpyrimidine kinase
VTADLKTIAAHHCYATACITALTVQSTRGVLAVFASPPQQVRSTLLELNADLPPKAVKVGMLGAGDVANEIADYLEQCVPQILVVDPIMASSSGSSLIDEEALGILTKLIIPRADVVTPNLLEASVLTGISIRGLPEMREAALRLHEMGARGVVIKGGHLSGPESVDFLSFRSDSGFHQEEFRGPRLETRATHGTGCAFASALACNLAMGQCLGDAVAAAKQYVTTAMARAYPLGNGPGPLNHLYGL